MSSLEPALVECEKALGMEFIEAKIKQIDNFCKKSLNCLSFVKIVLPYKCTFNEVRIFEN